MAASITRTTAVGRALLIFMDPPSYVRTPNASVHEQPAAPAGGCNGKLSGFQALDVLRSSGAAAHEGRP
jgi:hypothetical protein